MFPFIKNYSDLLPKSNFVKDTHRVNALRKETQVFKKGINRDIWVVRELNQLFTRGSFTEIKFSKKESS